jgi:hypothetical protein
MPSHDAKKIRRVGEVHLPHLAEVAVEAFCSLDGTSGSWAAPFRDLPIPPFIPPMYYQSGQEWCSAAQEFYEILVETRHRLEEAAEAVIQIADNYDDAEAEGARILGEVEQRLLQAGPGE